MGQETFSAALERLTAERAGGKKQPQKMPQRLLLREIHEEPTVFQPRGFEGTHDQSEQHIATLTQAALVGGLDEPLTVWWSGGRWIVVDGHHRLEAYRRAQAGGKTGKPMKALVAALGDVSLQEAISTATQRNARDKLRMAAADKMNAAWRLVCMGQGSIAEHARAATVSPAQISLMRSAKVRLMGEGQEVSALLDMSWEGARTFGKDGHGGGGGEWADLERERAIVELLGKLKRTFGGHLANQPEVLAYALARYHEGLPEELMRSDAWWGTCKELVRGGNTDDEEGDEAVEPF